MYRKATVLVNPEGFDQWECQWAGKYVVSACWSLGTSCDAGMLIVDATPCAGMRA